MCGIVGAVDLEGQRRFPTADLKRMARALLHRGPDDLHFEEEDGISMATRRLSIIDPNGGRQPMRDPQGDLMVSFNGELFDYAEQRRALELDGARFRTRCDTELWLHLHRRWGTDLFEKVRGQFAVALWDGNVRRLLLARDRFGICPLHLHRADGWLLWASEVKALLASGRVDAAPDLRGVDHLFSFFSAGTRRTCFEGVESLWPGHLLEVGPGRHQSRRYWDLDFPDAGEERRGSPQGLVVELEDRLRRAVRRRLTADVPVATYISGGLDSTVMLGLACAEAKERTHAFTIRLREGGTDEGPKAEDSARTLGADLTAIDVTAADIARTIPDLVAAAEGPIIDTADTCLLLLARKVSEEGYKVALTGEGADEATAGYPWYRSAALLDRAPKIAGLLRRGLFGWVAPPANRRATTWFAPSRPAQMDIYEPLMRAKQGLYGEETRRSLVDYVPFDDLDLDPHRMQRWHPLNRSLYVEYKLMLPGHLLLGKGDRVTMAASVEGRYPYLDEEVVEFCSGIDPDLKLHKMTEKWILRRVAERTLPARIADRPKHMFKAPPIFSHGAAPDWVKELLSPESLARAGYFDPRAVARAARPLTGLGVLSPRRQVLSALYTAVITTQLWHHLFLGGGLCRLPQWTPPSDA